MVSFCITTSVRQWQLLGQWQRAARTRGRIGAILLAEPREFIAGFDVSAFTAVAPHDCRLSPLCRAADARRLYDSRHAIISIINELIDRCVADNARLGSVRYLKIGTVFCLRAVPADFWVFYRTVRRQRGAGLTSACQRPLYEVNKRVV